jgi:hypothetical protein
LGLIRNQIAEAIRSLNYTPSDLVEVGKFQWENIITQVIETFVNKKNQWTSLHWAWQYFKDPRCSLQIEKPWKYLHYLVKSDEVLWFIAEENSERAKYWVYEGNVKAIQAVLEETFSFEYYLVSKEV